MAATLIGTFSLPWFTNFTFLTAPNGNYSGLTTYSGMTPGQKNYFWLTYNIVPGAVICNLLDAEFLTVSSNGTAILPTISSPAGYSEIGPCGVGVNELNLIDAIKVYPVPATEQISFSINTIKEQPLTVALISVSGQHMATVINETKPVSHFEKDISIHNFPGGVYYLKIVHGDTVRNIKIVKP